MAFQVFYGFSSQMTKAKDSHVEQRTSFPLARFPSPLKVSSAPCGSTSLPLPVIMYARLDDTCNSLSSSRSHDVIEASRAMLKASSRLAFSRRLVLAIRNKLIRGVLLRLSQPRWLGTHQEL